MKITKAVIPVAGKGTRFLPATKETPKEMIPIINLPMIYYAVFEAVESGIEQIVFVNSSGKGSLEDFFDRNLELENFLEENGKIDFLEMIRKIGTMVEIVSVRQKEQLGLGHAINCAQKIIGRESFSVILADDICRHDNPVTNQLIKVSNENKNSSVIGVMEVKANETNKYGIVDGQFLNDDSRSLLMKAMIEKPEPKDAPTNLATPGRYILTPEIFDCLEEIPKGVGGEYQLTDAINLLATRQSVYAHIFEGERFDTGSIRGYLDATVDFALKDPKYKNMMIEIMKEKREKFKIEL